MTPPPDPTALARRLIHGRTADEWPTWERWAIDAMRAISDLLAAHAQQAEEIATLKAELEKARKHHVYLQQELAGKACVQCSGAIDTEKGRCVECDERDAYLEAECERLTAERGRLTQVLRDAKALVDVLDSDARDCQECGVGSTPEWAQLADVLAGEKVDP